MNSSDIDMIEKYAYMKITYCRRYPNTARHSPCRSGQRVMALLAVRGGSGRGCVGKICERWGGGVEGSGQSRRIQLQPLHTSDVPTLPDTAPAALVRESWHC